MNKTESGSLLRRLLPGQLLLILVLGFFLYAGDAYRADGEALAALESDERVRISPTGYGWFFDGPSEEKALIFYPGGKVEETAYAPLLRLFAEQGLDVCLVKMPLRLAVLAPSRADRVMAEHDYDEWYLGGHSLGGAMAAWYASGRGGELRGLLLLAAYPTRDLPEGLRVLSICGSEDGVINREKLAAGEQFFPSDVQICELPGGNHARFGSYGPQAGDGEARISPEEQRRETAALVATFFAPEA